MLAHAKRRGCEGGGFFSLFTGQSPECQPLNAQIQQMRDNLDRTMTDLERLKSGNNYDQDGQRRSSSGSWRRVIAGRNTAPRRRPPVPPASSTPCSAATSSIRAATARRPAPSARSACARATAIISRFPIRRCRAGSPTMRAPVSANARRPRPNSNLSQSRRGHRPGRVTRRPVLFGFADRLPIPQRIQRGLLMPAAGPKLGGCAQKCRRFIDARKRRHRRDRPELKALRSRPAERRKAGKPGRQMRRRRRCNARIDGTDRHSGAPRKAPCAASDPPFVARALASPSFQGRASARSPE